jgi:DNA-binding NtrC family response regulator
MKPFRILIIDDDDSVLLLLETRLSSEGYEVRTANCGRAALALLETSVFDAALLDIQLPDMTGIEILEAIRQRDPEIAAVMMTGHPQLESAIQALRLGAYDYLSKPLDWEPLRHLIERIVERRYLRDEVTNLRSRFAETPPLGELIGLSAPIQELKKTIARVAATESIVLIEGESGTGKELVAYAIHRLSARSKGPFVAVNCAAIPAELMESELFGHVKGAFSSATANAQGLFRSAEKGTLFLDEIGDLPLQMQPKLLRVLQEREVRAVGGSLVHRLDVRVVAATNHNLDAAVQSGEFRQDLFFRLNVVRIQPPPLRSVKEDIPPLITHLLRKLNRKFGRSIQGITPDAMVALCAYDFPGNVRELENIIERAYALGAEGRITIRDLPSLSLGFTPAVRAEKPSRLADFERDLIVDTLRANNDNKLKTSEALGMSERTLYRRLKKHALTHG